MNYMNWVKSYSGMVETEYDGNVYQLVKHGAYWELFGYDLGEEKKFWDMGTGQRWLEKKLFPHKFELNWCDLCDAEAGPLFVIVGIRKYSYQDPEVETFGIYENYEDAVKQGEEVNKKLHLRGVHMVEMDLMTNKNHVIRWF